MFPVHVYQEGMELPKEGTYYVVAGNGTWLHKDTGIVKGLFPVENISSLPDLNVEAEYIGCNLPKIPMRMVWRIKKFFQEVVSKYRSEANTILYFNKDSNEFRVNVPQQKVSAGSVHYHKAALTHREDIAGFIPVGTIHSHCDFNAFHSSTDMGDEQYFDGLHCTFGHNQRDVFSISASIVVNGKRKLVDPTAYLEGVEQVEVDYYKFQPVTPELIREWSQGLDEWLQKVHVGYLHDAEREFYRGDQVTWVGDLKMVSFRSTCGDGPFSVDSVSPNGDMVTIGTKVGMAQFSSKLFKRIG